MSATSRRPLLLRLLLLAVLTLVAALLLVRAIPRIRHQQASEALCADAAAGEWAAVLAAGEELVGNDPAGRRAAECRCHALVETGATGECVTLLDGLLGEAAGADWLPSPALTALVVTAHNDAGDPVTAADLARRGARRYPGDPVLLLQELGLRSRVEDQATVLADFERRLQRLDPGTPIAKALRLELAARFAMQKSWDKALEIGGESADAFPESLRHRWFITYTEVLAGQGRVEDLARAFAEWERRGGDPLELLARHALLRSLKQLADGRMSTVDMLLAAASRAEEIEPEYLRYKVLQRLIAHLAVDGRHEEALAVMDRAEELFDDFQSLMSRQDLLRSATQSLLGEEALLGVRGGVLFVLSERLPGDRLLVSPDPSAPVDTPYESYRIGESGAVQIERAIGTWPQRWALRDAADRAVASGTVWPRPGRPMRVEIERRPASSLAGPRPPSLSRRDRSGPARVVQVILDCADWRMIQYGAARNELPMLAHAMAQGRRAVLDSDPPFTAMAMSRLVYPIKRGPRSVAELAHQIGGEIQGLNFVGRNPFAVLGWMIPEDTELFQALAQAGLETVNLLHSTGSMQVGRNAEIVGPGDRVRLIEGYESRRPLRQDELALVGDLSSSSRDQVEEMAADFDNVERLLREESEIDYVALRVASLDLLTHSGFQRMLSTGQDDAEAELYRAYRYADRRLAELNASLGPEDVLIIMSDHGIRTPMEHDRRALFLALGGGVEGGRIAGSPPLQHVSGWVADLLGLEVSWPGVGELVWVPGGEGTSRASSRPRSEP